MEFLTNYKNPYFLYYSKNLMCFNKFVNIKRDENSYIISCDINSNGEVIKHVSFEYLQDLLNVTVFNISKNTNDTYKFIYLDDNRINMLNKNNKVICEIEHDGRNIIELNKNKYDYTEYKIDNKSAYLLSRIYFETDGVYDVANIKHKFKNDNHIFTVYDNDGSSYKHEYHNDNIIKTDIRRFRNGREEHEIRYYYY